ncbi:MAG: ankyrin repeat domain-containing protein [Burkholderiaceae bacterium]|nr:MAG: ankyrin repeat domain-containing protein [Burkholderiaceae bacterium]
MNAEVHMSDELKALLAKIGSTADFGYVEFSDVNSTNYLGENALHIAVRWNDLSAVKLLVASGVDVNKHGEQGYTPLHYACEEGNSEMVQFLLDSGANVYARTEGDLPFTTARLNGNDAICDLLSAYMRSALKLDQATPENQHMEALSNQIVTLEKFISEHCDKDV